MRVKERLEICLMSEYENEHTLRGETAKWRKMWDRQTTGNKQTGKH